MAELYALMVDGKPVAYAYGEEWVAMGLYMDDIKFKTPEEAKAWWEEHKPKTNADRIRAMSDEELAHFIWNRDIDIVEKASVAGQFTFTVDREECFKNVLDWLKKEVEE